MATPRSEGTWSGVFPGGCVSDRRITLVNQGGPDRRRVTASLSADGVLVIAGVDSGPLVEQIFGDDDYEFWYTVDADSLPRFMDRLGVAERDRLLDALVADWSGERFSALQEVLRAVGATFHSF